MDHNDDPRENQAGDDASKGHSHSFGSPADVDAYFGPVEDEPAPKKATPPGPPRAMPPALRARLKAKIRAWIEGGEAADFPYPKLGARHRAEIEAEVRSEIPPAPEAEFPDLGPEVEAEAAWVPSPGDPPRGGPPRRGCRGGGPGGRGRGDRPGGRADRRRRAQRARGAPHAPTEARPEGGGAEPGGDPVPCRVQAQAPDRPVRVPQPDYRAELEAELDEVEPGWRESVPTVVEEPEPAEESSVSEEVEAEVTAGSDDPPPRVPTEEIDTFAEILGPIPRTSPVTNSPRSST